MKTVLVNSYINEHILLMPRYSLTIRYVVFEDTLAPSSGEGNGTPLQYFAWKIPWMEEPGRLQSMGSLRVGHDFGFTFTHWRRKWHPTPVLVPGESQGRGSLVAAIYGVTQSRTQLK